MAMACTLARSDAGMNSLISGVALAAAHGIEGGVLEAHGCIGGLRLVAAPHVIDGWHVAVHIDHPANLRMAVEQVDHIARLGLRGRTIAAVDLAIAGIVGGGNV